MSLITQLRIAADHKRHLQQDFPTQFGNRYWSYARRLSGDWNREQIVKRTTVVDRLLENIKRKKTSERVDLKPLMDDQRASGFIYGDEPLNNMLEIILKLSMDYPNFQFYGKWGGYEPEREGKRFVFYVNDKEEANMMVEILGAVSNSLKIPLTVAHQYGLTTYQDFVEIDESLRSKVKNREEFLRILRELHGFPHFLHELFE